MKRKLMKFVLMLMVLILGTLAICWCYGKPFGSIFLLFLAGTLAIEFYIFGR